MGVTLSEISSYELAYQIQNYLSSHGMTEEAFADLSDFPAPTLSHFLRNMAPEPSVSQIVRICNVLSISMDSLVKGPVQDKKFAQLIRKCHFAYKLKGTPLHSLYVRYLEIWQKRNLKLDCLERYTKWLTYYFSAGKQEGGTNPSASSYRLSSSLCFTQSISQKQKEDLEQLIEDSKKK